MNEQTEKDQFLDDINDIIDLVREKNTDDALSLIQECIPKYPESAELLLLTSVCSYHQSDLGRAIELCEAGHKMAPDCQEIVDSLAVLHVLVGNHNEGLYFAKLATTLEPHPDIPDLLPVEFSNFFTALNATKPSQHYLDGIFSINARVFSDAVNDFERELRINPDNNAAAKKLGYALLRHYRPADALRVLNSYAERLPGDAEVSALIALAHCQLAQFAEAVPFCQQALSEDPASLDVAMLVLEASMFFDASLSSAHSEFVEALNTRINKAIENEDIADAPPPKSEDEPINIALVSNSLFDSEQASFILPVLENIDPARFTLTVYQQSPTGGAIFNEIKGKSRNWRRIIDMDDDVVDLIFDRTYTDIVVDLCGFSENGRPALFAMSRNRLVTSLYCQPHGDDMANVNLVISDATTAAHDASTLRADQINATMESGLLAINEPKLMGDVSALPAISNKYITFGGTASLKYISGETVAMWSAILNAVPNSRLHLGYIENASPDVKERAAAMFADIGLGERVSVWNTDYDQRANPTYFNQIDIFLDTCPVSKPLDVCHALWMGVPVISRKSASRRGLMGASVLNAAGKSQWIAASDDGAVSIASALANDQDTLSEIRTGLRDDLKASALLDVKGYTKALEGVLEKSVRARG